MSLTPTTTDGELVSAFQGRLAVYLDNLENTLIDYTDTEVATRQPAVEAVNTVASAGTTETLPNPTTQSITDLTLTAASCALTMPTATSGTAFSLLLRQDASGNRVVTWPAAVQWPGSVAPVLSTGPLEQDLFVFRCIAGIWYGVIEQNFTLGVTGTTVWTGDASSAIENEWGGFHTHTERAIVTTPGITSQRVSVITEDPTPSPTNKLYRFTAEIGDDLGGHRCAVGQGNPVKNFVTGAYIYDDSGNPTEAIDRNNRQGEDRWFAFAVRTGTGWDVDSAEWALAVQWKQTLAYGSWEGGNPVVALDAYNSIWRYMGAGWDPNDPGGPFGDGPGGFDENLGHCEAGVWNLFVFHHYYHYDPAIGGVEVFGNLHNGSDWAGWATLVPWTNASTLKQNPEYTKVVPSFASIGLYRDGARNDAACSIDFAGFNCATSRLMAETVAFKEEYRSPTVGGDGDDPLNAVAAITPTGLRITANDAATLTHACARPDTAQVGDLALLAVSMSSVPTSTTVTGWTLIETLINNPPTNDTNPFLYIYRRVLDGTSTDDFSNASSVTRNSSLIYRTYSGVHATPLDVASSVDTSDTALELTTGAITGVTTAHNGALLVAIVALGTVSGAPSGAITGMTKIAEPTGLRTYLFEESRATAGATGTRTATWSTNNSRWNIVLLALRPA